MRGDAWIGLAKAVVPVAAPAVLAGVLHHVRAHGIEFDVAHAGEQVGFCLDQAGFVTPFPQAAGTFVAAVDVLHVASPDGLHELGYASLGFRGHKQVNVVGHEDVGVDSAMPIGSRFFQPVEVAVVVLLSKKAGLSIDAALNNMLGYSGQFNARATGHN